MRQRNTKPKKSYSAKFNSQSLKRLGATQEKSLLKQGKLHNTIQSKGFGGKFRGKNLSK